MPTQASREILGLCEAMAARARVSALSDLGVAASLAWAALESGALTVRSNLGSIRDRAFIDACERELTQSIGAGMKVRHHISELIAGRG